MKRGQITHASLGLVLLTASLGAGHAWAKPRTRKPVPAPAAASGNDTPLTPEAEAPVVETPAPAPAPPAPSRAPEPPVAPKPDEQQQLASLRSDVATLIDDMVEARARAALLGKTLFKTRLALRIQNLAAPDPVLASLTLKLDGAPVFRGDGSALRGEDARQVFEGFIAPGPHVLSVELEQRSQSDGAYGYTLHDSYRFSALREKHSELTLILDDDSDLAKEFPGDGEGEYDIHLKLRVRTLAPGKE